MCSTGSVAPLDSTASGALSVMFITLKQPEDYTVRFAANAAARWPRTISSREAATECSPRRKPWVGRTKYECSPEGAKETLMPNPNWPERLRYFESEQPALVRTIRESTRLNSSHIP